MSGKPICKSKTWDGYGYLHCSHRATMPSGYCKIHDPERVAARRQARKEKRNAKRQQTLKKYAEEEKARKFREHAAKHYDALLAACKRLINGKVSWSGTAMHPSGFFCSVCGMNSKMVVHAPGCPILEALNAIDAAEKDVTP